MDEIKDTNDDIDDGVLLFIGSNKEKFNFNTFNKLYFSYYNGKISLKEAEFSQENLEKKIEELKFNYKPKNEKEKEEIYQVLMQAMTCWNMEIKLLMHLKIIFFCLNI